MAKTEKGTTRKGKIAAFGGIILHKSETAHQFQKFLRTRGHQDHDYEYESSDAEWPVSA